jgi:hypothetical protein
MTKCAEHICPKCGHQWTDAAPPCEPREKYRGYLKLYLPEILTALKALQNPKNIAQEIIQRADFKPPSYWQHPWEREQGMMVSRVAANIRNIRSIYEIPLPKPVSSLAQRNADIAQLYATGKYTLRELGKRYGRCAQTIRIVIYRERQRRHNVSKETPKTE